MDQSFASRSLSPTVARFVSAVSLVMAVVAGVAVFVLDQTGGAPVGPSLGGDYAQFYAVGILQNQYGIGRLYDLLLQDEILHRSVKSFSPDQHLPYVHPPFLAPLFRPLALLPYSWSFFTWLILSAPCIQPRSS